MRKRGGLQRQSSFYTEKTPTGIETGGCDSFVIG